VIRRRSLSPGFRTVVFDCDSTLVRIEGIDELAGIHRDAVQALTDAAMEGAIPLEEVYGRRLALIRPTRAQVEAVGGAYADALVTDARETVAALRSLGKEVRVVSGGLHLAVARLAADLGLEEDSVAAVRTTFTAAGAFVGFDATSPLTRTGGKEAVLRGWRLERPALLVGDGATDAEARPAVDAFCAYMGVAHRPAVAAAADYVLRDESLSPVLALAAAPEERDALRAGPFAALLARGEALLARG
jgi:phosphoserine phosphatase